jgi:hypothetical protein
MIIAITVFERHHFYTPPVPVNICDTAMARAPPVLKGTVQRKLTGVLSGINQKLMICHCSDGYSFLI